MESAQPDSEARSAWRTVAHNRIERRLARFARDAVVGLRREVRAAKARDREILEREDPGPDAVIDASVDWLLAAQRHNSSHDAGVARHYALGRGWGRSYPETTGYIVSTLLHPEIVARRSECSPAASRAVDWLLSIQTPAGGWAGSVVGASAEPVTFNTGQILIGLADAVRVLGRTETDQVRRGAEWLVAMQDDDGAWRRGHSRFALPGPSVYELHSAWGLLEAADILGDTALRAAALRQVDWALGEQRPNGWFARCDLTDEDKPLTHTIAYAVRGLLEAWRHAGNDRHFEAALVTSRALAAITAESGYLAGRFASDWTASVDWCCLTGTSQMAICWGLLFEQTREPDLLAAMRRANAFVRKVVRLDGGDALRGGVPGAFPVTGSYCRLEMVNWAAKFTIDAQLTELRLDRR
jgi:hypothetical protein